MIIILNLDRKFKENLKGNLAKFLNLTVNSLHRNEFPVSKEDCMIISDSDENVFMYSTSSSSVQSAP